MSKFLKINQLLFCQKITCLLDLIYFNFRTNQNWYFFLKISFKFVESFEKLDLQLNIELWFTETDFKPLLNSSQDLSNTGSAMFTNLNNVSNSSANSGGSGGNNMQQV